MYDVYSLLDNPMYLIPSELSWFLVTVICLAVNDPIALCLSGPQVTDYSENSNAML